MKTPTVLAATWRDGLFVLAGETRYQELAGQAVGDVIYVGTDDAHVLRVNTEGKIDQLGGFDAVAGRDTWYAGSALINGQLVGQTLMDVLLLPDQRAGHTGEIQIRSATLLLKHPACQTLYYVLTLLIHHLDVIS